MLVVLLLKKYVMSIPDGGSSAQSISPWIFDDTELAGVRFPDILIIIIVLGRDDNSVRHCK